MNDHEEGVTEFGGVAGRVLHHTVSGGSLMTGLALGMVCFIGVATLTVAGAYRATTPFVHIILAFALARFAVNGVYGEWRGSVFSVSGGPWSDVATVALRYLCLNAIWMIPAMMLQPAPDSVVGAGMMGLTPSKPMMLLMIVYVFGMALGPPLFLIVSVAAESFGDVFLPDTWKRVFSGRLDDLFVVYAIYTGGLVMVIVLCMPVFMGAFVLSWKLGALIGVVSLFFVMGVSVNLLGRLCGFFACGNLGTQAVATAGATQETAVTPEPAPVTRSAPAPSATTGVATPPRPAANPGGVATALLDAKEQVGRARERYLKDPMGAILALEELRKNYAPHPQVLQALCLCRYRSGQIDQAVEIAREAVPLCFTRGHTFLAAEIFKELIDHLSNLNLNRDQLLIVADALVKKDDLSTAAKAYAAIINSDPKEPRAIKGLLNVSDTLLHDKSRPDAAAHVYRYLLQHCKSSPLAEFMSQGLEEAERRQSAG